MCITRPTWSKQSCSSAEAEVVIGGGVEMLIFSYLHLSQVDWMLDRRFEMFISPFLCGNFSGKISSYREYAEKQCPWSGVEIIWEFVTQSPKKCLLLVLTGVCSKQVNFRENVWTFIWDKWNHYPLYMGVRRAGFHCSCSVRNLKRGVKRLHINTFLILSL